MAGAAGKVEKKKDVSKRELLWKSHDTVAVVICTILKRSRRLAFPLQTLGMMSKGSQGKKATVVTAVKRPPLELVSVLKHWQEGVRRGSQEALAFRGCLLISARG